MKRILIYAAPFSYGPAGKALSIASNIDHQYAVELCGDGSGYELLRLQTDYPTFNCDSESLAEATLTSYDVLISCSDLNLASRAKNLGVKSVMLDSIFWYRLPSPEEIASVDVYVVQDFLGVQEATHNLAMCTNLFRVGAILRRSIEKLQNPDQRRRQFIVSYGGVESPYIKIPTDTKYPLLMTTLLIDLIRQFFKGYKVIFTGSNHIMDYLRKEVPNIGDDVAIAAMDHDEFLYSLSHSELALISPGIETLYEAIFLRTPTVLLPPHNATQYFQLEYLIKNEMESPVTSYAHYTGQAIPFDIPQPDQIRTIIQNLNTLLSHEELRARYVASLRSLMVSRLAKTPNAYEQRKHNFIKEIGFDGGQALLKILERLFT